jgi:D-beta-D-heptose 7-phosphate kinase/D-beta-D-heptose 1-phosphate adenosyltransferase
MTKIQSSVTALKKELRSRPAEKVVFTNGIFDLLHSGHIQLLEFARSRGDCLIVGVNSDTSTRKLKGPQRPLTPLNERMEILAAIRYVDYVIAFGEDTPARLIDELGCVRVLVKGGDYRMDQVEGRDKVLAEGGEVILFPFRSDISTTEIIARIRRSG